MRNRNLIIDPEELFFDGAGRSRIVSQGRSLYYDEDHLSPAGAEILLRPLFEPVFAQIASAYDRDRDDKARAAKAGLPVTK